VDKFDNVDYPTPTSPQLSCARSFAGTPKGEGLWSLKLYSAFTNFKNIIGDGLKSTQPFLTKKKMLLKCILQHKQKL
jgi:hypothetical protein